MVEEFSSSLSFALDDGQDGSGFDEHVAGLLVTLAFADGSPIGVHFEEPMGEAEALTHSADQLQDAVLEETGGAPHPPCPGHSHPAAAHTVGGVASWTCPPRWHSLARPSRLLTNCAVSPARKAGDTAPPDPGRWLGRKMMPGPLL